MFDHCRKPNRQSTETRDSFRMRAICFFSVDIDCYANREPDLVGAKPNIIFILTDDQGYGDLSAHGNPILKTVHLDKLRAEAFRFLDFHVSPTCAPTRSALFTGRHEFKNGITHTILERERLTLDAITLPQAFANSRLCDRYIWQVALGRRRRILAQSTGFNEMFIHGAGGIGQSYPGSCGDVPGNSYFDPIILTTINWLKTNGYCTDVFFDRATEWIK